VVFLLHLVGQHCSLAVSPIQYVGVSLPPGYVLHLRDDILDPPTGGVEAVVEADRVEAVAEVTEAGEDTDRAGGARCAGGGDDVADALVQRARRAE
jgi:hypothetical protein